MMSTLFGGKELSKSINPDEAMAYGAAYAGEFHIEKDPSGNYKLFIDNNSGTYAPPPPQGGAAAAQGAARDQLLRNFGRGPGPQQEVAVKSVT
ncbi:hypothetical protein PHYSODRAFT_259740 [Phytophthora sojae]|uniref:Uncharacterized protein n=1 Tax=Phytophthora sojae (strain P6497) TaxID=1094619 RepID=G5AGN5_PHYSP|nr:hypothetical protein PHYSODRAFT_259740 [Phytophthora sojae]EGZ05315.1 hypothetical protein PHYSODRAFT_259740 [Phytophthora sojae]|eukprot:XP_009539236.1 hypothetical protein PHYSODRAFT_259740 [Phytophthora sojae]